VEILNMYTLVKKQGNAAFIYVAGPLGFKLLAICEIKFKQRLRVLAAQVWGVAQCLCLLSGSPGNQTVTSGAKNCLAQLCIPIIQNKKLG
jgi:hypothetical protein